MKIEVDEDFGNMMVSAIRYGLWRRTYITKVTADYITPLIKQGAFSRRVLGVMDKDLSQYEKDRAYRLQDTEKNKWLLDDDCDYEAWSALHKAVRAGRAGVSVPATTKCERRQR